MKALALSADIAAYLAVGRLLPRLRLVHSGIGGADEVGAGLAVVGKQSNAETDAESRC